MAERPRRRTNGSTTNRAGDHAALLQQLVEGISALTTSEHWQRHLDCQSRFHRYSFGNVLLIATQRPGASRVAGFAAWKKLGRAVSKGEKAIWILAPIRIKKTDNDLPEDERVIRGFRHVAVFDISQTEGEELPAICHALTGDDSRGCLSTLIELAQSMGYSVEDAELPDGVNGDCTFDLMRIRIETRNTPDQRVKTLVHELAHALLHEHQPDRRIAELEAESTAYVVCRALGIDSGEYSFGYVASWAGGGDEAVAGIKSSGERIQKAAAAVLARFELEEQQAAA